MKRSLVAALMVLWPTVLLAALPDPVYQLFEDESDRMVIQQMPFEFDPISLGFDAASNERMNHFLNSPAVAMTLASLVNLLSPEDIKGFESTAADLKERTPLQSVSIETSASHSSQAKNRSEKITTATHPILMDRARVFEKADLAPLAREQYAFVLRWDPKNKDASKALEDLKTREIEEHMSGALSAQKIGAFDVALHHVDRILAVNPTHTQALGLKKQLTRERNSKAELTDRVSKDYLKGIESYQNGQLDLSLAHFVRVLNLDPNHKGALDYIEKIGERMKTSSKKEHLP
ncbi:MAG: hypothetical protein KCHDKBKB_02141 [Elusimicrobia bacterium]|nr:hypothetical protein [Elusimicrobiota bacterium]